MIEFTNREIGEAWMAFILGELYEQWPRRCDISTEMAIEQTKVMPPVEADALFDDLTLFLENEGYIRISSSLEGVIYDASLTASGQALLGRPALKAGSTMGASLKNVAAGAAGEAGRAAISEVIGVMFGAAVKGIAGS